MVDPTLEPSKASVYLSVCYHILPLYSAEAPKNIEAVQNVLASCVISFLRRNNFLYDSFTTTHASIQGVVVPQRLIPIDEDASEEEDSAKSRDFVSMNMGYSRVHGIKSGLNHSGESPVWIQNVLKVYISYAIFYVLIRL